MFQVQIQDTLNKQNIEIEKGKEQVMEYVAQEITKKIRNNDRRIIVLKSSTGSGKSTMLLYHLYKLNPGFKIFCSQVTITNTQEIAMSMTQMFPDLVLGENIGYQTGSRLVTARQTSNITYQTIKITSNQILKPLLFNKQQQPLDNAILIIDEAHSNDINMQEQLALVRSVGQMKGQIPFIIVQSASIVLEDFQKYLQSSYLITTLGQRNIVVELYLNDFEFNQKLKNQFKEELDNRQIIYEQEGYYSNDEDNIDNPINLYDCKIGDDDFEMFGNKQKKKQSFHKQKSFNKNKQNYKQHNKPSASNEFVIATEHVILEILNQSSVMQRASQQSGCNITGSILVFICKNKQMTDLYQHLLKNQIIKQKKIPIIQISAVLVERDNTLIAQTRIPGQKIIIATSVVETGFTFTDLSYVIDCLKTKYVYYNPNKKCEIQRDLPVDKNMQQQRRGRVGRTQGGIYIGICERNISEQLQDNREYQIQTSDLKQTLCAMGIDNFLKMQFIGKIPPEQILDVLQFQCLFGFQILDQQDSAIFNTFMTEERFKIKPQYKFLLLWSLLRNLRICEVAMVVCFLEKYQAFMYKGGGKRQPINQFADILKYIKSLKTKDIPQAFILLYNDIVFVLQQLQINLYTGISLLSDDQKEIEIVRKTFCDAFKQNTMIHLRNNIYKTLYGLEVVVNIQIPQNKDKKKQFNEKSNQRSPSPKPQSSNDLPPKYLTTNKIIDDGVVKAQFVVECSKQDVQDIYNICDQQDRSKNQKQSQNSKTKW